MCKINTDFYNSTLPQECLIHSLDDIIKIKHANGGNMPYLGYINVSVSTKDIDTANLNDYLMLVVPINN